MHVLKPFEYLEPGTVEEATQILVAYGGRAEMLAGGVHLVPCLRRREIAPECIVSIQRIPGLNSIEDDGTQGLRGL